MTLHSHKGETGSPCRTGGGGLGGGHKGDFAGEYGSRSVDWGFKETVFRSRDSKKDVLEKIRNFGA